MGFVGGRLPSWLKGRSTVWGLLVAANRVVVVGLQLFCPRADTKTAPFWLVSIPVTRMLWRSAGTVNRRSPALRCLIITP